MSAPAAHDATATTTHVVLATSDPVFAALCKRALAGSQQQLVAAVAPAELIETVRQLAPDLLLLDVDGEEVAALKLLATKVMLVSEARVVLVSAYLAPGSPGLCALLQSIAATFVHKPAGPSSLSLADEEGPAFVAALEAAYAAHAGELAGLPGPRNRTPLPAGFDGGWDLDGAPSVAKPGSDDD
jgi:chemotaxis response regulator CheB